MKKGDASNARKASKLRRRGGGSPYRSAPQDNNTSKPEQNDQGKLTRANKLSQAKSEHYEHSTCARGTVAECFIRKWIEKQEKKRSKNDYNIMKSAPNSIKNRPGDLLEAL